jgi:hypothetical protein
VIAPLSEIAGMIVAATTKRKKLAPFARLGLTITKADDRG